MEEVAWNALKDWSIWQAISWLGRTHWLLYLFFAERYDVAKSSISEDLAIVKHTLAKHKNGILETVAGASGGVRYIPFVGRKIANNVLVNLSKKNWW